MQMPLVFLGILLVASRLAFAQSAISLDFRDGHPRLSWPNKKGVMFQILQRESMSDSPWQTAVHLTGDPAELRWIDESGASPARFFQWRATNYTATVHRWQSSLESIRRNVGATAALAAIINTNGLWIGTAGLTDPSAKLQVEPQMRFGYGSLSKSFVAAALLQVAEEGRLTLDDSLEKWLPPITNVNRSATIRQLLDHTSGVRDFTDSWDWYYDTIAEPARRFTAGELFTNYVGTPYHAPGAAFHYSNSGYVLAGLILEAATGRALPAELRRRFFEPLGLRSLFLQSFETPTGEVVHPFSDFNPSGQIKDISAISRVAYFSQSAGAGALFGTIQDLARWTHNLWNGSILSEKSTREMLAWNPVGGAEKYGLAVWSVNTGRGEFYVHSGHVPGFRCYSGYSPTLKTSVLLFFNNDHLIEAAWRQLVAAL